MFVEPGPFRAIAIGLLLAGCTAANVKPQPPAAAAEFNDVTCLSATGASRISEPCLAAGRAYSSEEIRRTGASTVGEALRLLDPSITVSR